MRRSLAAGLAALSIVAAAGCASGDESILDEGARFPDAEGIVTEITLESIQIDDGRTYPIGENVESFTTRSHEPTPLLSWKEKYVHVGLREGVVRWIAGIGTVVKAKPPYTLYSGVFERLDTDEDRVVFEDGTTLALGNGVQPPTTGEAIVTIDPAEHVIIKIESP